VREESRLFRSVHLPHAVRVGPRALRELADDCDRIGVGSVLLVRSAGLPSEALLALRHVLAHGAVEVVGEVEVVTADVAQTARLAEPAGRAGGVLAFGGGRALDVGKYSAALASVPVVCVPTSLSHDGFASPSASLLDEAGRRRSFVCKGPAGVLVDTDLCATAPRALMLAGVGDIVAKVSALADWWVCEHAGGGKVDGAAAAVAESAVSGLEAALRGGDVVSAIARGLLLGGVAMAIAGSSRPCSGAEHLISHALDTLRSPVGSHGLQVAIAAFACCQLRDDGSADRIARIADATGLWDAVRDEAIARSDFVRAVELAPGIKPGYLTVLSRPNAIGALAQLADTDPLRSLLA
jgi:glycerol-1-phosphate dehydrogenase [NAD(P)+]